MLNVSEPTVATGAKVRNNAAPELKHAVMSGNAIALRRVRSDFTHADPASTLRP